ncbi:hypothetical protein AAVH_40093, partial [Aphelenchoides avenae]
DRSHRPPLRRARLGGRRRPTCGCLRSNHSRNLPRWHPGRQPRMHSSLHRSGRPRSRRVRQSLTARPRSFRL